MKSHTAQNFSLLNRIALNLLKQDKSSQRGIKGKRLKAGWDHSYLLKARSLICVGPDSEGGWVMGVPQLPQLFPKRKLAQPELNSALLTYFFRRFPQPGIDCHHPSEASMT
jgi:hypothetical protein